MTNKCFNDKNRTSCCFDCSPDICKCRRAHLFPVLLILASIWLIYSNSLQGTWIFDDGSNIVENKNIRFKTLSIDEITSAAGGTKGQGINRPLSYITFGINYFFGGLNPLGYHLVNISIHCISSIFLYLLFYEILNLPLFKKEYAHRSGSIALLATFLWAIHPIHVTSITYIVQRMTSMAAMFYIIAMYFYLKARIVETTVKRIYYFSICFLAAIFAIASKENAAMLPITLYMMDFFLIKSSIHRNIKKELLFFGFFLLLILLIIFSLTNPFNMLNGYRDREFTLNQRLLTQPRVLVFYLYLLFYPIGQNFTLIYDIPFSTGLLSPWTTLPAILFWIAWFIVAIFLAKRRPLYSFLLLFFILNHAIEGSFIPLELIYEHRNYLPSIALFLLASIGIIELLAFLRPLKIPFCLLSSLIAFLMFAQGHTVTQRNMLFKHPLLLWSDNVEKSPNLSRVQNDYGKILEYVGKPLEARNAFLKAIELNRYPKKSTREIPYLNLADNYLRTNEYEKALNYYEMARSINPKNWEIYHSAAKALIYDGKIDKAKSVLEYVIARTEKIAPILSLHSFIMLKQKKYIEAIEEAKKAIAISPNSFLSLKVLGQAYMNIKDYKKSFKFWHTCAILMPEENEPNFALFLLASYLNEKQLIQKYFCKLVISKGQDEWEKFLDKNLSNGKNKFKVLLSQENELIKKLFDYQKNREDQ